ncbi:hypothetical protein SAMN05421539_102347 [Jannaschia seohaensis]|uniref:Uncharacterized protein n=1 Tax=Jannaschia seohaensis TaxID=475081 RepID=A0A2Y9AE20_9RHOB|nr:hypothetical protein BCF38_102347 [Jannaschia seohaensis]SSA41508.1 hypothetical protein SAMN05421539_102347 [Jannaschia seohaensis]
MIRVTFWARRSSYVQTLEMKLAILLLCLFLALLGLMPVATEAGRDCEEDGGDICAPAP